ncbi:MAG: GNAT family N-acetyltransferase [Steroidobacteraceae bacterium]
MGYVLRAATLADRPALRDLIELSARVLGGRDYRADQVEAALRGAFGVDTTLIEDGTYFVAELPGPEAGLAAGTLVGCGGWSRRRTLFGGDSHARRDAALLDPAAVAARIRAFFVHPGYERRGVGRALLAHCEQAARAAGFRRFELMGTLPGVRLYEALGYSKAPLVHYPVGDGVTIEFVPMTKQADHG